MKARVPKLPHFKDFLGFLNGLWGRFWRPALAFVIICFVISGVWIVIEVEILKETNHGIVIAREYHEAWDEWVPEQRSCTPFYDSDGNKTGESCITVPGYWRHHPPIWRIRVRDEEKREDWLDVSEQIYNSCTMRTYFPGQEELCHDQ